MKQWQETAAVLRRAAQRAEAGGRAASATVVRISGSAYRRPGAKFLVEEDGQTMGSVSGGCLEADVREHALGVMRSGVPRLLHYETGSDDRNPFGLGLGCNGTVDVFVQPATTPQALEAARRIQALLEGEQPFAVATLVEGAPGRAGRALILETGGTVHGSTGSPEEDRQVAAGVREALERGESRVHVGGGAQVFTEVLSPPPHLVLLGAGDDARPLAVYAADMGFRVTVVDHRPAYLTPERFPGAVRRVHLRPESGTAGLPLGPDSFVVVKTHSLALDREWLRSLLPLPVRYIGLLGPRARTEDILQQLGATRDERIYAPVGLDVGAEGPEQVALAVVAELLGRRVERPPRHLRERGGPIHAG